MPDSNMQTNNELYKKHSNIILSTLTFPIHPRPHALTQSLCIWLLTQTFWAFRPHL